MNNEMTSKNAIKEPLLRVLSGDAVWPPPIWLMRQAGRYLPEFRSLRAKADFLTRCFTPDIAVELTMQPIRRFKMDGAILFSDILILPFAMGQELRFEEGKGPIMAPITDANSLAELREERVAEVIAPILETLRRLRKELPEMTTLIGFAGSPFTVACYMIEGHSSQDFATTREMILKAPELFERIMALLVRATGRMLLAQIEAGAQTVMLFDSWSGLLPPSLFRKWVISPTKQIVAQLKSRFPQVKVIGFPRLSGVMALEYAEQTGIDALACDTSADLPKLHHMMPKKVALQGNMDPFILRSGGRVMVEEALNICQQMRGKAHIFNLGHGVMPSTPPEHVEALVCAIREDRML